MAIYNDLDFQPDGPIVSLEGSMATIEAVHKPCLILILLLYYNSRTGKVGILYQGVRLMESSTRKIYKLQMQDIYPRSYPTSAMTPQIMSHASLSSGGLKYNRI
jgi:hypothetical protein